jgi:hypothetical protein
LEDDDDGHGEHDSENDVVRDDREDVDRRGSGVKGERQTHEVSRRDDEGRDHRWNQWAHTSRHCRLPNDDNRYRHLRCCDQDSLDSENSRDDRVTRLGQANACDNQRRQYEQPEPGRQSQTHQRRNRRRIPGASSRIRERGHPPSSLSVPLPARRPAGRFSFALRDRADVLGAAVVSSRRELRSRSRRLTASSAPLPCTATTSVFGTTPIDVTRHAASVATRF